MKKLHDQLLRNIHTILEKDEPDEVSRLEIQEQLLRSSALPAHQYIHGFKNFQHVLEVACNQHNLELRDIEDLLIAAFDFWYKRTYKQHKVPFTFYIEILSRLNNLKDSMRLLSYQKVKYLLEEAVEHLKKNYSYKATYKWRAFFEQVLKQFKVIMGDKL